MYNLVVKLFGMFHPPQGDDARLQAAWRNVIGWGLTLAWGGLVYVALSYAAGVPGLVPKVVFVSDIRTKVEEATSSTVTQVAVVAAEVTTIKADVKELKISLNESLAQGKAAEIRAKTLRRCTARTSLERDSFNREIDQLQFEYKVLMGERYDTPRCSEL